MQGNSIETVEVAHVRGQPLVIEKKVFRHNFKKGNFLAPTSQFAL